MQHWVLCFFGTKTQWSRCSLLCFHNLTYIANHGMLLSADRSATEFSVMITGLDSRKMKLINDYSVSDLDAPMGPNKIQNVSFTQSTAISKIFSSILDPGPATAQGPTEFLETDCGLHKKMQRPDKCQAHTEVLIRWKMSGNYCVLKQPQ